MEQPRRRIMRHFLLEEISGVDRPAQAAATVLIIKRQRTFSADELAAFNADGDGPMHERLRDLYDNALRGHPGLSPEACFALAWNGLSLADRRQIRAEESGEAQEREAEEARLRAGGRDERTQTMKNVDLHSLALLALEGAAEALRKADPDLTREQAFSRAFTDNPDIAKIERQSSRDRLVASMAPRRETNLDEPIAKRDHALGELRKIADEIRQRQPALSEAQAFVKAYTANPALAARERSASRELMYAV